MMVRKVVALAPSTTDSMARSYQDPSATVEIPKRMRAASKRVSPPVHVDKRVCRVALELAGGDATRIHVISATSVYVSNRSRKK